MTAKNIGGDRPLRVCDLCGGVDDHPRHVIAGGVTDVFPVPSEDMLSRVMRLAPAGDRGRLVRDLMDTSSSDRHMDCCREAGCPGGSCDAQLAGAGDKRGADLLEHLMNGAEATS